MDFDLLLLDEYKILARALPLGVLLHKDNCNIYYIVIKERGSSHYPVYEYTIGNEKPIKKGLVHYEYITDIINKTDSEIFDTYDVTCLGNFADLIYYFHREFNLNLILNINKEI